MIQFYLSAILTVILVYIFHINFKSGRLPGPFQLPFLGSILQVIWMNTKKPGYQMYTDLSKVYGSIYGIKIGLLNQVVVNDLDVMKEALANDDWSGRYTDSYLLSRSFNRPLGLIWGAGAEWKEIRKYTISTLKKFGFGKNKSMEHIMGEEFEEIQNDLNSRILDTSCGTDVCFKGFFTISTLNIVWSLMAGHRFARDDPELLHLCDKIEEMSSGVPLASNIVFAFPFLQYVLPDSDNFRKFHEELHVFFRKIIAARREEGRYKEVQEDFFDVFLKDIDEKKRLKEPNNYYTDDQFVMTAIDLVLGGAETSSNTLEFAILAMILNPGVQEKLQNEIDTVVGRGRQPNFTDVHTMPYTHATTLEILRMSNALPLAGRGSGRETKLGKYTIPMNYSAYFNIYGIHTDENVWENPMKFQPERFLDKDLNIINANKILPFGYGKRMCPGEIVGKATVFTFLANLLQNYTFKQSEEHPAEHLWMKFRDGFTLSPLMFYAKTIPR